MTTRPWINSSQLTETRDRVRSFGGYNTSSTANRGLEAQSHQAVFLMISGPDIGGKSARSPQGALSHSLKTIHKVRTVPYPSEKLIECLVGLV